jgi:hypothetical protein
MHFVPFLRFCPAAKDRAQQCFTGSLNLADGLQRQFIHTISQTEV